jgi:predicted metal-dependent hydrolase
MTLPAYSVTRKPVKYTRIRVSPPDGRVTVTAPRHVSEAEIAAFVAVKAGWIARHQQRIASAPAPIEQGPVAEELRGELYATLGPLIAYWADRMGLAAPTYGVRRMKTRWGTCNVQRRHITIALELARRDEELLEYVVVHELAHLYERGHGPAFKAVMSRYLPEWPQLRSRLNAQPLS